LSIPVVAAFALAVVEDGVAARREAAGEPALPGDVRIEVPLIALLAGIDCAIAAAGSSAIRAAGVGCRVGVLRSAVTLLLSLTDAVSATGCDDLPAALVTAAVAADPVPVVARFTAIDLAVPATRFKRAPP
jgi:hypothetical protein